MKVLVSGGAGFIGSTVSSACLDRGITPIIVDNLSTGNEAFVRDRTFYHGDIADGTLIDKIFTEHADIAAAIHCAGLIVVPDSVRDPLRYYRENLGKAIEFVDHLVRNRCRRLIFSSSASVYAQAERAVDETTPTAPTSPYGRTKAMMEGVLEDCAHAYDLRVISLRYFNPIGADPAMRSGPHGQPTNVLAKMIEAAHAGAEFTITGVEWPTRDGTGMRDYVHVWDLALAHVCALTRFDAVFASAHESPFLVVNLGSGRGTTVRELANVFSTVSGYRLAVRDGAPRHGDLPGGYALRDRAWQFLEWRPMFSVEDGVRHALHWMSSHDRAPR